MSDSNLDFLLRKAIRSGLNYLSLSPNYSNPKGAKWCAAYRHAETNNCQYVDHDDPIEALEKAIRAGEREARLQREHRVNVEEPAREATEKLHRRNGAKVAKQKEAAEALARKRRRDAEDLA